MTENWVIARLHELEDQIKALDARVKVLEGRAECYWNPMPYSPLYTTPIIGDPLPPVYTTVCTTAPPDLTIPR